LPPVVRVINQLIFPHSLAFRSGASEARRRCIYPPFFMKVKRFDVIEKIGWEKE
jgi:hypothetical protein